MKLCLVCSSGGHFLEMYFLKDFWEQYDRFWVTFFKQDNLPLLCGSSKYTENIPDVMGVPLVCNEKAYNSYYPTNRSIKNLIKNTFLAFKILRKEKPDIILSTGAGVGVPFVYIGKLLGMKTIYVELETRVNKLSLTARLIYYVVDHLIVQWPELADKYNKAVFAGQII